MEDTIHTRQEDVPDPIGVNGEVNPRGGDRKGGVIVLHSHSGRVELKGKPDVTGIRAFFVLPSVPALLLPLRHTSPALSTQGGQHTAGTVPRPISPARLLHASSTWTAIPASILEAKPASTYKTS